MKELSSIVDGRFVITDDTNSEALDTYSHDISPFPKTQPLVVVKPHSALEVSKILELANKAKTPVLPFGSAYSFTGLSNRRPKKTIVIDMKAMNKVVEINESNMSVTAECGIIVGNLSDAVKERGFLINTVSVPFYKDTLGGMISGVIGGGYSLHSSSNGLNNRHILNLKVVLPNGQIVDTAGRGANISAKSQQMRETNCPDITGLFIGDGGSFGVKVESTLAMYPLPTRSISGSYFFENLPKAWSALSRLMEARPLLYDTVVILGPSLTKIYTMEEEEHRWSLAYYIHGFDSHVEIRNNQLKQIVTSESCSVGNELLEEFAAGLRTGEPFWGESAKFADSLVRRASIPFFIDKSYFLETFLKIKNFIENSVENERRSGIDLATGYIIRPILQTTVWGNLNIYYYTNEHKDVVLRILKEAYLMAVGAGASLEPHGGFAADVMGANWSSSLRFLFRQIKTSLDPCNILNPDLWG